MQMKEVGLWRMQMREAGLCEKADERSWIVR